MICNIFALRSSIAILIVYVKCDDVIETTKKLSIYEYPPQTEKPSIYVYHHYFMEDAPVKLGQVKHHVFLYDLKDPLYLLYKAFCSGSIISEYRVLTSANCLLTNRKRLKHSLKVVKVGAAVLTTKVILYDLDKKIQFRTITKIFSQYAYRFPIYNLAVLQMDKPWIFNRIVNRILIASIDQDFNGTCMSPNTKATESWYDSKHLITNQVVLVNKDACETIFSMAIYLYYCIFYEYTITASKETEGAGVICHGTTDSAETESEGLLVGVTSSINIKLPTLLNRVGMFNKWITDRANVFPTIKHELKHIKVMAGVLSTYVKINTKETTLQHRSIEKVYSQREYRYPAFNLMIVIVSQRWHFNIFVNKIILASINQDFNGTCHVANAKVTKTWSYRKFLVMNEVKVIPRYTCDDKLFMLTELYYCTEFTRHKMSVTRESEGAGMICQGTQDPAETEPEGILVGISSIPSLSLPTLNHRVGKFHKWITDQGNSIFKDMFLILICLIILL